MPVAGLPIPDKGLKGAFCLSRNWKQYVVNWLIFVYFHGYKKITYTHRVRSFSAIGGFSIEVHLPSPAQTGGIRKENPGCARGPFPLTEQCSERRGCAPRSCTVVKYLKYLKHSCLPEWGLCTQGMRREQTGQSPWRCKSTKDCT